MKIIFIHQAEKKFRKRVEFSIEQGNNRKILQIADEINELYFHINKTTNKTALRRIREKDDLIEEATQEINYYLELLNPIYKKSILEGLEQSSEIGKLAYMKKILNWSITYSRSKKRKTIIAR